MRLLKYGAVLVVLTSLWGCGKGNESANSNFIDPVTQKHTVQGWSAGLTHGGIDNRLGASNNMATCQECHGKDFSGGISKVSCLNTAGCHGAGILSPHPPRPWRGGLVTHTLVKESTIAVCAQCHTRGANLAVPLLTTYNTGAPGCFNGTLCHITAGHGNDPTPWSAPANHGANPGTTGRPGAKFSIQACQSCHATPSSGANTPFTNAKTGMPGGCSSTGCHDQNVNLAHPYVWLTGRGVVPGYTTSHATAGDLNGSCAICHGAALNGVGGIAPSCMSTSLTFGAITVRCHSNGSPAATPTGCTSCHGGTATGPSGVAFPNTNNKHAAHLTGTGLTCDACHSSFGPSKVTHANGFTNISFSSKFTEGSAVYTSGAGGGCSNISCHGGKTTGLEPWNTAAYTNYVYDPTGANCTTNCHGAVLTNASNVPGANYIGVYNGDASFANNLHEYHSNVGAACTDCHRVDPANPTQGLIQTHFLNLSQGARQFVAGDPKAKGFAAATVGGNGTKVISYVYSAVAGKSSCLGTGYSVGTGCHGVGDAPSFGGIDPITGLDDGSGNNKRSWFQ